MIAITGGKTHIIIKIISKVFSFIMKAPIGIASKHSQSEKMLPMRIKVNRYDTCVIMSVTVKFFFTKNPLLSSSCCSSGVSQDGEVLVFTVGIEIFIVIFLPSQE